MSTTYDVRIYKIEVRRNATGKVTSHRVRWEVDGERFTETFKLDTKGRLTLHQQTAWSPQSIVKEELGYACQP